MLLNVKFQSLHLFTFALDLLLCIHLCRQGLVVLETVLPKGEFYAAALCYNPKTIPATSSAPFLVTLYSDTAFNFV